MKQKLLFSLLALLVSVGMVSAQNPKANQWIDVYGKLPTAEGNVKPTADKLTYKFKKADETNYSSATTYTTANTTYKGQFQFYTSTKGFQDGTFMCEATATGYKGEITIVVDKAEFNSSFTSNPTAGGFVNFQAITEGISLESETLTIKDKEGEFIVIKIPKSLKEGDQFIMIPQTEPGYTFNNFTLTGIQRVSGNEYKVKGTAASQENISVVANYTANSYAIAWKVEDGAGNGSVSVTVDGNAISSGAKVTTGKKVVITLSPNASYSARLATAEGQLNPDVTGGNVYTVDVVDKALNFLVFFELTDKPTITFKMNADVTGAKANGEALGSITSDDASKTFTVGTTVIISDITLASKKQLAKVLMNTTELEMSTPTSFSFKMPANNANITFVTEDVPSFTVASDTDKDGLTSSTAQEQGYDGSAKPFKYTVTPAGLTGFNFSYSLAEYDNYNTTVPTSIGKYKVRVTRAADATYGAYDNVATPFYMNIVKGKPEITTIPTVTVNSEKKAYVISGGVAKINGKTLTGLWKTDETYNENNKSVNVYFVVQTGGKDDDNYEESARVKVGVATTTYTLTIPKAPEGMTLTAKQGDVVLTSGSKIVPGVDLDLTLEWVAGYTGVNLQENKADATNILTVPTDTRKGTGKIAGDKITGNIELKFIYSGSASPEVTLTIALAAEKGKSTSYTGTAITATNLFKDTDFTYGSLSGADLTEVKAKMKITYKQGSTTIAAPMNAGKYTVSVAVDAFTTAAGTRIKAFTASFADAFEITKKELTLAEITKPELAYVAPGQKLANALFVGGAAPIVGVFQFMDGDVTPKDGETYAVKFIPTDKNNYAEVELGDGNKVKVSVANTRVLIIDTPINGTIKVVGNDNKTYTTGMELPGGVTSLTITATPAAGYILATLTANGATIASGGTFTIGAANTVEVKATFTNASSFKVNFSIARGVQLVSKTGETAAAGKNFTFTLATAEGDVPRVTDEDGTVISRNAEGVYTLEKVLKDKTIRVSLASPTAISIETKANEHGTIKIENLSAALRADEYFYGDTLRLTATPEEGGKFRGWWDKDTTNPRLYVVKADQVISMDVSPVGILPVEDLTVYGAEGYIYVSTPTEVTVTVVSMTGRSQKVRVNGSEQIEVPAGIYGVVVEQGDKASKLKVVVR